jgi:hypothetical protein
MDSPLAELDSNSTWDIKTKNFLRGLKQNIADPVMSCEDKSPPGTVNILNADRIFVESGKEYLLQYAPVLFSVLDALDDRDRAYRALFHLLQGTFYIAGHAVIPVEAMRQSDVDASQAALARAGVAKKMSLRDEIVRAVVAEKTKDGQKRPSVSKLIKAVNPRLSKAGEDEISERQLRIALSKF